jgi:hypothetical protein
MFYPGSRIRIRPFSHPGSKHIFIPDPGSYMKSGMQSYCFLASFAFRSIVFVIVKKDFGSEIRKKFIPDLGGKKAPDPESATLHLPKLSKK